MEKKPDRFTPTHQKFTYHLFTNYAYVDDIAIKITMNRQTYTLFAYTVGGDYGVFYSTPYKNYLDAGEKFLIACEACERVAIDIFRRKLEREYKSHL